MLEDTDLVSFRIVLGDISAAASAAPLTATPTAGRDQSPGRPKRTFDSIYAMKPAIIQADQAKSEELQRPGYSPGRIAEPLEGHQRVSTANCDALWGNRQSRTCPDNDAIRAGSRLKKKTLLTKMPRTTEGLIGSVGPRNGNTCRLA